MSGKADGRESEMRHHDDDRHTRVWTVDAVRQLGMTTDIETAAEILGIGRTLAFELAKTERFPVRLLRMGRRIVVPVADLLTYLGVNARNCIGCTSEDAATSRTAHG